MVLEELVETFYTSASNIHRDGRATQIFIFHWSLALNDGADLFSQEGLLINIQPSLHYAQVLKKFGIRGDLFNHVKQGGVDFHLP